jgi:hypothetical protein
MVVLGTVHVSSMQPSPIDPPKIIVVNKGNTLPKKGHLFHPYNAIFGSEGTRRPVKRVRAGNEEPHQHKWNFYLCYHH